MGVFTIFEGGGGAGADIPEYLVHIKLINFLLAHPSLVKKHGN